MLWHGGYDGMRNFDSLSVDTLYCHTARKTSYFTVLSKWKNSAMKNADMSGFAHLPQRLKSMFFEKNSICSMHNGLFQGHFI